MRTANTTLIRSKKFPTTLEHFKFPHKHLHENNWIFYKKKFWKFVPMVAKRSNT